MKTTFQIWNLVTQQVSVLTETIELQGALSAMSAASPGFDSTIGQHSCKGAGWGKDLRNTWGF